MRKDEKLFYMNMPTRGYWSEWGGLEVKDIQYGIEDYAVVVSNAWSGNRNVHRVAIHYKKDDAYIVINGRRYYFSECLRV